VTLLAVETRPFRSLRVLSVIEILRQFLVRSVIKEAPGR
jgi:hypothetical protein